MKRFAVLLLLFGLVACSTQRTFSVGNSKVHVITHESFAGPNTAAVFQEKPDGTAVPVSVGYVKGLGHALLYSSSAVAGAYLFGSNMPADTIDLDNSSKSTGGDASSSSKSSSSSTSSSESSSSSSSKSNGNSKRHPFK